jgi:hypothetical protein
MADSLGEERGPVVQKVVDEVFNLFAPMARHEWLPWGGELLFPDLQEAVEREVREVKVKRRMEEEAAEAAQKKAEEEGTRRSAAEAKAAKIEAQRAALGQARREAMLVFRAKALSREELQRRNTEFASEASSISQEEARVEEGVKDNEEMRVTEVANEEGRAEDRNEAAGDDEEGAELPVIEIGKRRVTKLGEDGEEEVRAKRTRFTTSGLLDFEGPVNGESLFSRLSTECAFLLRSAIAAPPSKRSRSVWSRRGLRNARSVQMRSRAATGRGCHEGVFGRVRQGRPKRRSGLRAPSQVRIRDVWV